MPPALHGGKNFEVAEAVFGREFNEPLVHQLIVAYMAAGRSGTKAQKTRAEVRGGGAKPWRQKGTGKARAGTSRSPLWRGGGVVFAARPRNYKQKLNKKMYRGAMCSIFSELLRQGRLVATEEIEVAEPKTKLLLEKIKGMNFSRGVFIADNINTNLYLAARNVPSLEVCDVENISPVSLVASDKVIVTNGALKKLEATLLCGQRT